MKYLIIEKMVYFYFFSSYNIHTYINGLWGLRKMWNEKGWDCREELESSSLLDDVMSIIGLFLVSALGVVYLGFLFGPIR